MNFACVSRIAKRSVNLLNPESFLAHNCPCILICKTRSYGGTSSQSPHGPGTYGYTWWWNPNKVAWPSAPADAFQCNGWWNRRVVTMVPSLQLVAAWGTAEYGDPNTFPADMDPILKVLVNATHTY